MKSVLHILELPTLHPTIHPFPSTSLPNSTPTTTNHATTSTPPTSSVPTPPHPSSTNSHNKHPSIPIPQHLNPLIHTLHRAYIQVGERGRKTIDSILFVSRNHLDWGTGQYLG